jgi:aldehyde:ferredoxin oxidoreductase
VYEEEPFKVKEMTRAVMKGQNLNAVKWSLGLCDFWGTVDTSIMADFMTLGLGKKCSAEDLEKAGERIWNLNRMFNIKAGFTEKEDVLSDRFIRHALKNGPHQGRSFDVEAFEQMKTLLYQVRGWDKEGRPGHEKLAELNLLDAL